MQKIVPFLWFDTQSEDAAHFYVSVLRIHQLKMSLALPMRKD